MSDIKQCNYKYYEAYEQGRISLQEVVQFQDLDTNMDAVLDESEIKANREQFTHVEILCDVNSGSAPYSQTRKFPLSMIHSLSIVGTDEMIGTITSDPLKNNTEIDGRVYKAGSVIELHENGTVLNGTLANDTTINGITYKAGFEVYFLRDGSLHHGALARDTMINGIIYKAGFSMLFMDGRVLEGVLARDTVINGITYKADSIIYLNHDTGEVLIGTLARNTKINGFTYIANSEIAFDEDGNVIKGVLLYDNIINRWYSEL